MNEGQTFTPDAPHRLSPSWKVTPADLPRDWKIVKLGDVIDIQGGSQPPKADFIYEPRDGYVRLLQIRDFGDKPQPTYVPTHKVTKFCTREDIFIARYGASLGRILTGMEGAYNVALAKVTFDRTTILPKYLFYLLQTPYFQTPIHMISRSAQNGFNKGEIFPIEIPLAPYPQQKLIVAEIEKQFSRLDEAVANLKRVKANLKRYKAAVLKAAVEGKLTEEWRKAHPDVEPASELLKRILAERRAKWNGKAKYKEPIRPDTRDLPLLPGGWTWTSLDQLVRFLRNGISIKPDAETGLRILRISALRPLSVSLEDVRFLNATGEEFVDYILNAGDLLFTRYNGNSSLVGVCAVVPSIKKTTVHPDKLIRGVLVSTLSLPMFVAVMANFGVSRHYLAKRVRTTAGQAGISGADLRTMPVPLAPVAEQECIVEKLERRLSLFEELQAAVIASTQRAERLCQTILCQAFTGQLKSNTRHERYPY
jgi:type I restriction enzyme S subunit